MKTIWKYSLGSRRSVINVPSGGRPVAFEVEQLNVFVEREVYLMHTGEEFDSSNLTYVGTALTEHDTYVLHCYVNEP